MLSTGANEKCMLALLCIWDFRVDPHENLSPLHFFYETMTSTFDNQELACHEDTHVAPFIGQAS